MRKILRMTFMNVLICPTSSTLKPSSVKIHILNPLCLVAYSISFICNNLVSMG